MMSLINNKNFGSGGLVKCFIQLRIINVELVIYLIAACSNGQTYGVQIELEMRQLLHPSPLSGSLN
jgi:hypothetical protein